MEILDAVYELEGLLHLLNAREDMRPNLTALIQRKAETIHRLAMELNDAPQQSLNDSADKDCLAMPDHADSFESYEITEPGEEHESIVEVESTKVETPVEEELELEEESAVEEEIVVEDNPKHDLESFPTFSLNDRYLFIREIFGGNAEDFTLTTQKLSHAKSIEEVKSLLGHRLNLDSLSPTGERYLSILGVI